MCRCPLHGQHLQEEGHRHAQHEAHLVCPQHLHRAQEEQELRRRARLGDYAGGPAMILLPFFALAFYRRED